VLLAPDVADGVAIGGSLNEIGDLDTCLAAVRRVLAPDGRFVAMTLARSSGSLGQTVQRALGAGGLSFWSSDELVEQFARHGLRTLRREQHGIVLFTMGVPVER
jgi:ubiquinone/menaquinone biosynthesis C-methylase UbiE